MLHQRETLGWVDGLHRTRSFSFFCSNDGMGPRSMWLIEQRETALAAGAAPEMLVTPRSRIEGMDGAVAHDRAILRLVMDWERVFIGAVI